MMNDPAKPAAEPAKTHKTHEWTLGRPIFGVRFDPQMRYVCTGSQTNHVHRWKLDDGSKVDLVGHDSWVRALAYAGGGDTLLSGGYDGRLIWWPLAADQPTPARTVQAHQGWLRALAVSPDGAQVASCGNDNLVKVWSVADGSLLHTFAGHARHVYHVAYHPAGGHLISADLMGTIKAWDLASGQEFRAFDGRALHSYDKTFWADMGGARGLAFRPDGKQFAVAGITEVSNAFAGLGDPVVVLFDWEKAEPVKVIKLKEKFIGVAWNVVYHPAGYLVVFCSGNSGGALGFIQPDTGDEFFHFKAPTQGHDFALAPDGLTAAIGHNDGKLRLYRLAAPTA